MPPSRRLNVMVKWPPVVTVTRLASGSPQLCYVVTANRIVAYPSGRSKVVFIGATEEGLSKVVTSVASRADQIFQNHDLTHFEAHVVTCKSVPRVPIWQKLERALLITFRDLYGSAPLCNAFGSGLLAEDEFDYFSKERIENVLEDLG